MASVLSGVGGNGGWRKASSCGASEAGFPGVLHPQRCVRGYSLNHPGDSRGLQARNAPGALDLRDAMWDGLANAVLHADASGKFPHGSSGTQSMMSKRECGESDGTVADCS